MAHISTPPLDRPTGPDPHFRRPEPEERRTALAVLLTGRPGPDQPAVDHFLNFAQQQNLSLEGLWAAYEGPTPVYASLIIPGVGRTAVLFVAPVQLPAQVTLAADLVAAVVAQQAPERVRLIQALLEPTQRREEQALGGAGFQRLASLVYMRRSCFGPTDPATDAGPSDPMAPMECDGKALTRFDWHEDHHDAFARAIDVSYEATLDCPGLVGVRRIDDILAGHMAVGRFTPELWSAYYLGDEPAAVMLLNPLVDRAELELVYLGLSPAFRGKGLATRLMRHAVALAQARQDSGIHLAVDQANAPAVKLYKGLGFRATGRKTAMIHVIT